MLSMTLLQLASASIDLGSMEHDKVSWLKPGGAFSVKSAYEFAFEGSEEGKWVGWKHIWSLRVQQRVKVFIWLLGHEAVLTNYS